MTKGFNQGIKQAGVSTIIHSRTVMSQSHKSITVSQCMGDFELNPILSFLACHNKETCKYRGLLNNTNLPSKTYLIGRIVSLSADCLDMRRTTKLQDLFGENNKLYLKLVKTINCT